MEYAGDMLQSLFGTTKNCLIQLEKMNQSWDAVIKMEKNKSEELDGVQVRIWKMLGNLSICLKDILKDLFNKEMVEKYMNNEQRKSFTITILSENGSSGIWRLLKN